MSVANDIKSSIRAAKKIRLPWWGVLCLIIGSLPIYWLFDHFSKLSSALPTLNCIAVLCFAIATKWKLRRGAWFWFTMAIIAALHIPLILFLPWTARWVPAFAIAAIDSVDLIVILAILSVVGRLSEGPRAPAG